MKIKLTILSLMFFSSLLRADGSGILTETIPDENVYGTAPWYSSSVSYTSGGVTFTFPENLFTSTPVVTVSVVVGTYSDLTNFVPEITAVSATSVTVRVNSGTLLSLGEAATDSCTVQIWAVSPAD